MTFRNRLMLSASPIPYLAARATRRQNEARVMGVLAKLPTVKAAAPRHQRKVLRYMGTRVEHMSDAWLESWEAPDEYR